MFKKLSIVAAMMASCAFSSSALAEQPSDTLPSGVIITHLSVPTGTAKSPAATDMVKVHYRGTLKDGREFDSSYRRGTPATFPLNRVIPCWTEALQKMKVGEKAKLFCPSKTAYGSQSVGALIGPNTDLNFEVELLAIQ